MAAGRKEEFKQATVYLCNSGIRFTKRFYPSVLYFFSAFVAILKKIRCIMARFQPQFYPSG